MVAGLVALGVMERVAWNALRPTGGAAGEAMNIAQALGDGRGFADAYRVGQGATAHLLPMSPGLAGGVYRLFGTDSRLAEALLAGWSIGLAMLTYLVLFRTFGRLGTPAWARLGALAVGCLAPTYVGQEAVDFRVWDGGLTMALAALLLDRIVAADAEAAPSNRSLVAVALLAALLFFSNPTMGLAMGAGAAWLCLRRLPWQRTAWAGALSGAVLLAMVAPWTLRNEAALGEPVPLRSNAGLELSIGMDPAALYADNRRAWFLRRLDEVHPSMGEAYDAMVAAGGEVEYARRLGRAATDWMRDHPGEAAALLALHVRQSIAPEPWQFDVFGRTLSPTLRATVASLAGVIGVLGIGAALVRRRRGWVYPALMVGVLAIATSPFQPATRYTYLFYPVLLFAAADLAAWLVTRQLRSRRRAAGQE